MTFAQPIWLYGLFLMPVLAALTSYNDRRNRKRLERLVASTFDLARGDQARVDRVPELGHHDEVVQRRGVGSVTGFARLDYPLL